jgi:hypothetical protein
MNYLFEVYYHKLHIFVQEFTNTNNSYRSSLSLLYVYKLYSVHAYSKVVAH